MMGHFNNILCVLHSINNQKRLIEQAIHVAETHQAKLTFQLALEKLPPNASLVMASLAYIESHQSIAEEALERLNDMVATLGVEDVPGTRVSIGTPYYDVIQQVLKNKHDLVIAQSENGVAGFVYGADARHLLRKCPCPVWMIHEGAARNYKVVLATVDVNYHFTHQENVLRRKLNEDVLISAAEIALLENAQLHIVHVYEAAPQHMIRDGLMRSNQQQLDAALAEIKAERADELKALVACLHNHFDNKSLGYLKPKVQMLEGSPAAEICQAAADLNADVVVMGTVARVGVPGLLMGNTAEDTLSNLDCAILALKPQGFVSIVPKHKN